MQEIWRPIFGHSKYLVSSLGRIKRIAQSKYKDVRGRIHGKDELILSGGINSNGYYTIILYDDDNKKKSFKIHRLAAIAFLQNANNYPSVNHKNGIKIDNRVENLEWCTQKYNVTHAVLNGLIPPCKGEQNSAAKITEEQAKYIKYNKGKIKRKHLADMFGLHPSTINFIQSGRLWPHI